jgi:rod shape-determining protein MreC
MSLLLQTRKNLILLGLLIVLQLLLISLQIPLGEESNYFEKGVFFIFAPVKHAAVAVYNGVGSLFDGIFSLFSLKKENKSLSEEMDYLRQENLILKNLIARDSTEGEMRDLLLSLRERILMARVIGLDHGNFFRSFFINRGSSHGVVKDMVVLDQFGQLVGRVAGPISLMEARVQLITDIESGIAVYSGLREVTGVLAGNGQGLCLMKHILATDENVQAGQIVHTSGFDGIYPPGIPVGVILSVKNNHTLFKDIAVRPLFNFRRLDRVAVIKLDMKAVF